MPGYSVIADVSATLQSVLTSALSNLAPGPPVAEVHDLTGQISTNPARVTIFLFEVVEDPSLRNRPPVTGTAPPNLTVEKPPVALLLRYLMTPWSGDRLTDHQMLGRTVQTFYDGAILRGPQLQGGLVGTSEALKLKLAPLSLEERTRVWHAVERPYRLSLTYEVRVVNLDTTERTSRPPVRQRVLDAAS